jgi:hypothetical protein
MDTMLAWLRDPQYESCNDALVDFTDVQTTPTVGELRELIAMLKQEMPARGPRRTAVVTSRPITFVIARVFAAQVASSRKVPRSNFRRTNFDLLRVPAVRNGALHGHNARTSACE